MISDDLAGRRILLTGATGFLGTAILERILRSVPDCDVVILVRPGRRTAPDQRAKREIFRNDCFDRLRGELAASADFDEMVARRVRVVGGDVSLDGLGLDAQGRETVAGCDIVIHSAATVSFDSPLDSAVEVNLLGPSRIAGLLNDLGHRPHLISVSTCYVAGNRRGSAPEQLLAESPFRVDVDWRTEVDAARRARTDAEALSRSPDELSRLRSAAQRELGAAGTPLLAAKTEQLRHRWVSDRMVAAGKARAASLGWPDAYAYTKALGEQALMENRGDVPVSIVRPSIIESAWAEPRPGWIRGFRMAEPIIISYARGLLKEFPGVPEGIVDVIPVDMVSSAILAVAATGPAPEPQVFQVASGSRNPLRYGRLVDLVNGWFTENPLVDSNGQPIVLPKWSFPGRGRVQGQLRRAEAGLARVERLVSSLPIRGAQAEWTAEIERKREDAERALAYVELYGAYAECEAVYGIDRTLALAGSLDRSDNRAHVFDPLEIDWDSYVREVHLPSVVDHARVRTADSGVKKGPSREERLRAQVLAPERQLAAFDLENTLIASNVVASYAWLATRRLGRGDRIRFIAKTLAEAPGLLALDKRDRSDFLRHFYRRYEGAPVGLLHEDVPEMYSDLLLLKSFPEAIRRVRDHRRAGHRTLLITGALDKLVEPLAPLFDDIVCAGIDEAAGELTGQMLEVPPTGETRAQALFDYCASNGLDPAECVAYADSTSDLPLLEAVGFPVAVNPEARLASLARKRGWLVENFAKAPGAPRRLLPIAPPRPRAVGVRS